MLDIVNVLNILYITQYVLNGVTILGSFLSFIIFSRKAFEKSSIGLYCKSLAIFDLFVAYNLGYGMVSSDYEILCQLAYFISTGISPIPGWILVVFSFDQLIIVSRTDRFKFFKKRWFQYSIILGIAIFNCALYSPIFMFSGLQKIGSYENQTFYSCELISFIIPIVYMIESTFIPFVFIIISTSLIVRTLIKSRQKVASNLHGHNLLVRRLHELKFALSSVILNVLFIFLTFPLIISHIIPIDDYLMFSLMNSIFLVVFYLNFATHFWVHLVFNSVFRHEFLIFIRVKK